MYRDWLVSEVAEDQVCFQRRNFLVDSVRVISSIKVRKPVSLTRSTKTMTLGDENTGQVAVGAVLTGSAIFFFFLFLFLILFRARLRHVCCSYCLIEISASTPLLALLNNMKINLPESFTGSRQIIRFRPKPLVFPARQHRDTISRAWVCLICLLIWVERLRS